MTISQIKYFLEAVDCGSFQKASEKLYISRQALSKQIRAVETELGFALLDRKAGGSLKLSKAGEILYDTWKEFLRRHENAIFLAEGLARGRRRSFMSDYRTRLRSCAIPFPFLQMVPLLNSSWRSNTGSVHRKNSAVCWIQKRSILRSSCI